MSQCTRHFIAVHFFPPSQLNETVRPAAEAVVAVNVVYMLPPRLADSLCVSLAVSDEGSAIKYTVSRCYWHENCVFFFGKFFMPPPPNVGLECVFELRLCRHRRSCISRQSIN